MTILSELKNNSKEWIEILDKISSEIKQFEEFLKSCAIPQSIFIDIKIGDEDFQLGWCHQNKRFGILVPNEEYRFIPSIELNIKARLCVYDKMQCVLCKINDEIKEKIKKYGEQND